MEQKTIDTAPLSFFRFAGIAAIVFLHYGIRSNPHLTAYARAGSIIVFFYMLSGFVLFLNYQRKGQIDMRHYLLKRSINILPLYYVGFLMFLAILLYMGNVSFTGSFLALLCLQSWVPGYQHYVNPPSWFVSGLMFFYLVFPLIFARIKRTAPDPGRLLAGGLCLWLFTIVILNGVFNPAAFSGYFQGYFAFIESFPLANFSSFYLGVCGAYYVTAGRGKVRTEESFLSNLGTAFILVLCVLTLTIHYHEGIGDFMKAWLPYEAGLYAPVILLLILHLSTTSNSLTRLFSMKIFILLGVASYPLYILQAPVYHLSVKFISRPLGLAFAPEFGVFVIVLLVIAGIMTVVENVTVKRFSSRVFGSGANAVPKRSIGQAGRFQGSKADK